MSLQFPIDYKARAKALLSGVAPTPGEARCLASQAERGVADILACSADEYATCVNLGQREARAILLRLVIEETASSVGAVACVFPDENEPMRRGARWPDVGAEMEVTGCSLFLRFADGGSMRIEAKADAMLIASQHVALNIDPERRDAFLASAPALCEYLRRVGPAEITVAHKIRSTDRGREGRSAERLFHDYMDLMGRLGVQVEVPTSEDDVSGDLQCSQS